MDIVSLNDALIFKVKQSMAHAKSTLNFLFGIPKISAITESIK